MKIVYLLTQSLDSPSGLGRYLPLAVEMHKLGVTVEIFALHPDMDALEEKDQLISGVQVHYISPMHIQKKGNIKNYYSSLTLARISLLATWHLIIAGLNSNADIIHIAKPHPMNSIAGVLNKMLKHTNLFLDCDDYEAASGNFSSGWQKSIVATFEKWTPRHVNMVTTNTHFMEQMLESWGVPSEKIVYLPNGVDRERFIPPSNSDVLSLREELNLDKKKIVSYIGSMSLANHAVDLIIKAFPKIIKSQPNALLLLVGGGEDFQKLQDLVNSMNLKDNIRFAGKVPPEKVSLYYAISDVTVDPVYDNDASRGRCPLKLFESWTCEVPFVTSNVGDRQELIGDPPAGLMARPGDPDSLANSILKLLSDKNLRKDIINQGNERIKDYYWDKLAVKMFNVYQNWIDNKNRS
jgi:glycosyltransferase involved in cell wall biosynthesis